MNNRTEDVQKNYNSKSHTVSHMLN